ncbi:hypothetical protein [Microbacterium indicum]|uniref:hypothetical protein n=1 Tax=Microbacterium indicum TaxID=358100 RepID=UPI00040B9BFB|nr:hypothetical protein [Microbacterium indicum]
MPKTVAEKLQIKPGSRVFWGDSIDERRDLIAPLPDGATGTDAPDDADVAVVFIDDRAALERLVEWPIAVLGGVRAVWIVYPKGGRSDVNRDIVWRRVAEAAWRLVSNVSVDDTWSAVRAKPLGG